MSLGQTAVVGSEYGLSVGVSSWELDLWGRVRALKDAALEEFLAGSYARHSVQAGLIAEVTRVYLSLQTLDEQIHIAQQKHRFTSRVLSDF
ncbi:Outer membrane protein OprM [Oligella ureolytica]